MLIYQDDGGDKVYRAHHSENHVSQHHAPHQSEERDIGFESPRVANCEGRTWNPLRASRGRSTLLLHLADEPRLLMLVSCSR